MDPRTAFPSPLAQHGDELTFRDLSLAIEVEYLVHGGANVGDAIQNVSKDRGTGDETVRSARRRYKLQARHWIDEIEPEISRKLKLIEG